METITSVANDKVKLVKKLNIKKYRQEYGMFVVEGINILKDMPETTQVECFFATENVFPTIKYIVDRFSAPCYIVSDEVMKSMADTVSPSGLLAVIRIIQGEAVNSNALVLDRISDSGNLGTLIRTAVSAGFCNIYLINCVDVYSGKTARASMGGIFRAQLIDISEDEAIDALKGYHSIAMDMNGEDISLYNPTYPVAIVLGSESQGVSKRLLQSVNEVVSLEMQKGMESLNVAVAGGIAMYFINNKLKI